MAPLSTAARRVALSATLAVLFALLFASPAAAHAELVNMTPPNGAQLATPPTEVQMTFTESVNLVEDGIHLVDQLGATVPTPDPTVEGNTVTWPMPADLPDGPYIVTWRVVSSDGHPISGASSFGVGTAAAVPGSATSTGTADTADTAAATGSTAPWPVVTARLAGYVAFALFAGVAAFVLWCAPGTSRDPTLQLLVRGGLLGGAGAAIAAILVQGPYTAGVSMSRVLDTGLLRETLSTPFGAAMMWRLGLYAVLGVLAWRLPRIVTRPYSWLVPAGVVATAVTIAAAGHAAASGPFDLVVDALHALTAGLWVGGLVALVALGRSVEPRALHRFSTLAMASVLTLVVTGTLNSLRHLTAVEQLWSDPLRAHPGDQAQPGCRHHRCRRSLTMAPAAEPRAAAVDPARSHSDGGRPHRHRPAQHDPTPTTGSRVDHPRRSRRRTSSPATRSRCPSASKGKQHSLCCPPPLPVAICT